MIYSSSENEFSFYRFTVTFKSSEDGHCKEHTNDASMYELMVATYSWKFSELKVSPLVATPEQEVRLSIINTIVVEDKSLYEAEVKLFVEEGAVLEDSNCFWLKELSLEYSETTKQYLKKIGEINYRAVADLVNVERDKRINSGFEFNGVRFQSRADDRENIKGAVMIAMYDPTYSSDWIAEDNSTVRMDAATLFAFGRAAAEHKQHLIFKARQIKDMSPIPEDFTDDKWWV